MNKMDYKNNDKQNLQNSILKKLDWNRPSELIPCVENTLMRKITGSPESEADPFHHLSG